MDRSPRAPRWMLINGFTAHDLCTSFESRHAATLCLSSRGPRNGSPAPSPHPGLVFSGRMLKWMCLRTKGKFESYAPEIGDRSGRAFSKPDL